MLWNQEMRQREGDAGTYHWPLWFITNDCGLASRTAILSGVGDQPEQNWQPEQNRQPEQSSQHLMLLVARQGPQKRSTNRSGLLRFRRGFTLVELLVMIAIIGVLVALLLPAVQAAREAARRTQCQSNLKQAALAVLNYESAHGMIPEGTRHAAPKVINRGNPKTGIDTTNWAIHILPYVEHQALYDRYDSSLANRHPDNLPVLRTPLSIFKCPSDSDVPSLMVPTQMAAAVGPEGIATSSYKRVSGTRWGATNGFFDYIPFFGDYVRNCTF